MYPVNRPADPSAGVFHTSRVVLWYRSQKSHFCRDLSPQETVTCHTAAGRVDPYHGNRNGSDCRNIGEWFHLAKLQTGARRMNQTHGETLDETVRKRFESAWRDGVPQAIEDLLPDHADPRRLATLEELVHIELEFAWKQFAAQDTLSEPFREPASVESYVQRFPQLNAVDVIQRLKEQEVYVRQRYAAAAQDPALRPARLSLCRRTSPAGAWHGNIRRRPISGRSIAISFSRNAGVVALELSGVPRTSNSGAKWR